MMSLIFAVLFLYFYPPIYGIRDESVYMGSSYVLRQGTLDALIVEEPVPQTVSYQGKSNPYYPLGTSLLLIPFTLQNWRGAFLLGLLCHLLGAWIFRRICLKQGITHPLVFSMYLFFPAFVLFSRTVMSDMPSLLIVLFAYDAYFSNRRKWQAGALFGLALLFRSSNVILILPFLAVSFWRMIREGKREDFAGLLLGYLPFAAGNALYSWRIYGSPFLLGHSYQFTGMKSFSLLEFPSGLREYFLMLNIAYPLMLLLFFAKKDRRPIEGVWTVLIFLGLFSIYDFFQRFPVPVARFVFGSRYLFPAIPFLIMGYGYFLTDQMKRFPEKIQKIVSGSVLAGLILSAFLIHSQHQKILTRQKTYRDFIYTVSKPGDALLYDVPSSELILKAWGDRVYIPYEGIKSIDENRARLFDEGRSIFLITRQSSYSEGILTPAESFNDASKVLTGRYQLKPLNAPSGFRVWEISGIKSEPS